MRKLTVLTISLCLSFSVGNLQAAGKGKGPNKTSNSDTTITFVNGFSDSITPGLLCPWEQLNACESSKEVFVLDETKKANGDTWYTDKSAADEGHVDVCMNERDAPTTITLWELSPKPIDLSQDNGCTSPCNMLVRQSYTNRTSCHENIRLKQDQALLNSYDMGVIKASTRTRDNFFCHSDNLPPNVSTDDCLASTSTYCHRGINYGETPAEYEAYLEACLSKDW